MTAILENVRRFRTIRAKLGPARFTSDGEAGLVGYALDLIKDAFVGRAYESLLARFPATAPPDALPLIGRDRRVRRGRNEPDDSYRARLPLWLDDRKAWGSPWALLKQLAEYTGSTSGCSWRTVDNRGNWFSRAADGTRSYSLRRANWNWDGQTTKWSRFWVICYPGTLWLPTPAWGAVGGPTWGDNPYSWGSTATADDVASLRAIVADWKPAGTRCVSIILAFDPTSFDPAAAPGSAGLPDGLWGSPSKNVGGVQVPSRLETAIYWPGS